MKSSPKEVFQRYTRSFADNALDENLSLNLRLSYVAGFCTQVGDSLKAAGFAFDEKKLFMRSLRKQPITTLTFLTHTFAGRMPPRYEDLMASGRTDIEWFELALPSILEQIPVQRVCATIPDLPNLGALAIFVEQQGFPRIANLLTMRAQSQIKPKLGFA